MNVPSSRRRFPARRLSLKLGRCLDGICGVKLARLCGQIMVSDRGNIVNFSELRKKGRAEEKRRERAEKEARAAANRVRFGRTGVEKKSSKLERDRIARLHEGNRREPETGAATEGEDKPGDKPRG